MRVGWVCAVRGARARFAARLAAVRLLTGRAGRWVRILVGALVACGARCARAGALERVFAVVTGALGGTITRAA